MIETIAQLRDNHSQFDVLWNEVGRETQELMVKNAPQLLERMGTWYNQQNKLIVELEDKYQELLQEKDELIQHMLVEGHTLESVDEL